MNDIYNLFKELTFSKKTYSAIFNTLWILTVATFIPFFSFIKLFDPFRLEYVPFFESINNNYIILFSATSIFLLIQFFILLLLLTTSKICNRFNRFLYDLFDFTSSVFSYFVFSIQILKNIGVLNYSTIDFIDSFLSTLSLNNFICFSQLTLNYIFFISLILSCFKNEQPIF